MHVCLIPYASEVLIHALINSNSGGRDGHGAAYCQTIASEKSRVNTIKMCKQWAAMPRLNPLIKTTEIDLKRTCRKVQGTP